MTKTTIGFEIAVIPSNEHSPQVFNKFTGEFQKDSDNNCLFKTREEAAQYMDIAREAWNEYDVIHVNELSFED